MCWLPSDGQRRSRAAIQEELSQGTLTLRLMAALHNKVVVRFRIVELIVLLVIIILMVPKLF
jgi:hypothetical protein